MAEGTMRRTEAKAFFANERTFLHWMSTSVTIGSIAAALSGIAGHAHRNWGEDYSEQAILVRIISLIMLVIAITISIWSGLNFSKRTNYLIAKMDGPYDSRVLPVLLCCSMIMAMGVVFGGAIMKVIS